VISVVADVATTEYATVDIDVSCSDPETAAALPVTMSALDTCGGALTGGTYSFATSEQDGETGCEAVFECSDGIDVSIARTHVAIAEANQPPVVDPFGAPAAGSEGIVQLSATDLDEPAHFLTWSLAAQPTCAAAYVDLDGRLVYRCSEAALCDATVEVTDGYADGTVAATVPLDCTGVAPPAAFDVRVKGDVSVEGQASECFYRFLAPSGAADASTVEWLVGSTVIATGAIMDTATGHLYGDSITCRVTPSDGTTTGLPVDSPAVTVRRLRQVSNILPGGNPRFANFTAWNDRVYFIASDMAGNGNSEIWVTDGTTTQLMLGTDPPGNTRPQDLTLWNSRLYFRGTVDGHSGEVWSSDGTSMDYTFRINVAGGSDVQLLRVIDDRLFMVADDGYQGREIFVSDDGVTVRVFADGMAGSAWMNVTDMGALLGDQLIFGGGGGDTGSEPHVVRDGLSGSTTLLGDLRSGWAGSNPRAFHSVHGVVVFVAQPSQPIVWRTDGSAAGTGPLGTLQAWNFFQRLPDGRIYATRFYNGQSMDMLSTDGTEAGTRLLFRVSGLGQSPGTQAVHDGRIWFSGTGPGGVGREFWVTDGTESGTAFVADVWPGADDSYASNFAVTSDGRVFFSAAVGTAGDYEVWVLE
jgi:ELWxxDGT repeat protein